MDIDIYIYTHEFKCGYRYSYVQPCGGSLRGIKVSRGDVSVPYVRGVRLRSQRKYLGCMSTFEFS